MRELLLAQPRDPILDMVHRDVVSVPATMDREELAALMRDRRFIALPVVDQDGRLLGIVKHDEVLEAVQEEAFGDLQKLSGAGEDERALSPVPVVVKKRLPWLLVNLATAFMASAVIGMFEGVIERVTALAVLLPIVAGQGGNTGAQSLAVVIRGIALRELGAGTSRRVMIKEVLAALLNGVAVALVTGLCVYLWDGRIGLVLVILLPPWWSTWRRPVSPAPAFRSCCGRRAATRRSRRRSSSPRSPTSSASAPFSASRC